MHPHISEPCRYAVKHWKDRLNSKRKQSSLVLQHSVLKIIENRDILYNSLISYASPAPGLFASIVTK